MSFCCEKSCQTKKTILVAAPTGFLTSRFRTILPDEVSYDTVHSIFRIPVHKTDELSINCDISRYDMLIIDEISMISQNNFQHILNTLNRLIFRPVLHVCGDNRQQQPFEKTNNSTHSVPSSLNNRAFLSSTYSYTLKGQHRVGDPDYLAFLDHIRNWVPNESLLSRIQEGRVLGPDGIVNPEQLMRAFQSNPNSVILTFTNNAANYINNSVVPMLFANDQPIANCQLDTDTLQSVPIYKGMRVMITRNRDKQRNIVNGQIANVHTFHNGTILLKLPGNKLVATSPSPNGSRTCYPFRIAYGTTMCKAQGQTLEKAILWFDIDHIPPGTGYVALSRVRRLTDVLFLTIKNLFFSNQSWQSSNIHFRITIYHNVHSMQLIHIYYKYMHAATILHP